MAMRTRDELLELFGEQIGFLERSNELFDQGHISEAKRMATTLRILFRNTRHSHALIHQLDLHDVLTWVDSAGMPNPKNLLPEWGLVQSGINVQDGKGRPIFRAPLGDRPPVSIRTPSLRLPRGSRILLNDWWTEHVVKDADGTLFSRMNIVLAVADKEGGAHVDPDIEESYNKIANLNSMGWTYSEGPDGKVLTGPSIPVNQSTTRDSTGPAPTPTPAEAGWTDPIALDNPVPYMLRQISYEVVESVRQQSERIK